MSEPEIVRPAPDAERDERVRLRRAADARRAGIALDALLAEKHYLRGLKWFTNRGDVETCNCGEPWPHNYEG